MSSAPPAPPRVALIGDRSPAIDAHARIPGLLRPTPVGGDPIEMYWLRSTAIDSPADVAGFDGIWVVPGSPYESMAGVLAAVTAARTGAIPFLGTCGGFQHMLLEFARQVCGRPAADHAEVHPDAEELLLVPLECRLLGEEETVTVEAGTRAAQIMGAGPSTERYFCRYGLNRRYEDLLRSGGLVFSGRDAGGEPRIVELPDHPFFLGTLFQPELSSDPTWIHPLIGAFAAAVRERASVTSGAGRSW